MAQQERVPRRAREELQLMAIREILRATAAALPLNEILSVISNMTIIVFDATTSWFMLAQDGRLRTVVSRGEFAEELAGKECKIKPEISCVAATGDKPVIIHSQDVDASDPLVGILANQGESVVLLPLKYSGRTLGMLGSAVTPEASLDISFLITMAEQAAGAVESARLREETRTWRQRLDAIFERMSEAVLVIDREGKLALMNRSAEELLRDRNVRLGDSLADLLAKADLRNPRGLPLRLEEIAIVRALRGERVDNAELDLPLSEGVTRHFLVSAAPFVADGQVQGVIAVWRDISNIKETERMRAEFLSMVSHELRNPLTSIVGFAQLLQRELAKGRVTRQMEEQVRVIIDKAKRLNDLVGDVLDSARAEAGELAMEMKEVDLSEIIRKTVTDNAALAPNLRFRVEIPPKVSLVRADPGRIEQVMMNLLSNAVKFSPPDREIAVRLEVKKDRIVVSVSDQGVGIAKENIPNLFLPFRRAHQLVAGRDVKGVGLGLFVSRSIVEAHGGEMWVRSQFGKGSTFYFSLPLAR